MFPLFPLSCFSHSLTREMERSIEQSHLEDLLPEMLSYAIERHLNSLEKVCLSMTSKYFRSMVFLSKKDIDDTIGAKGFVAAARCGNMAMFHLLLCTTKKNYVMVHSSALRAAALYGQLEVLEYYYPPGRGIYMHLNTGDDTIKGDNILRHLIEGGCLKTTFYFADRLRPTTENKDTLKYLAAKYNQVEILSELTKKHPESSVSDRLYETAVGNNSFNILKWLVATYPTKLSNLKHALRGNNRKAARILYDALTPDDQAKTIQKHDTFLQWLDGTIDRL